jgi:hypothetical protein
MCTLKKKGFYQFLASVVTLATRSTAHSWRAGIDPRGCFYPLNIEDDEYKQQSQDSLEKNHQSQAAWDRRLPLHQRVVDSSIAATSSRVVVFTRHADTHPATLAYSLVLRESCFIKNYSQQHVQPRSKSFAL